MTPFLFYLVGGYCAFTGQLDVGSLVAVIAAYKDLPGPVKELIDWDQQRQDVQIKYEQVIEQFQPEGMLPEALQALPEELAPPLAGDIALNTVIVADDDGVKLLDGLSRRFPMASRSPSSASPARARDPGPGADAPGAADRGRRSPSAATIWRSCRSP